MAHKAFPAESFISWLDEQLSQRGWTDYQLAKQANLSPSVISRARSGTLPKWDACESIAYALRVPVVTVFQMAGLIPLQSTDPSADEANHLFMQLSQEDQSEILAMIRLKIERRDKQHSGRDTKR